MIKEVNFGSAIKLGKTLELSWHWVRGNRWKVTQKGDEFIFEDMKGEFATTVTTKANIKYWVDGKEEETPTEVMAAKAEKKGKLS